MSGGANRKKTTRSQGWEEAGSEFYQESYPADSEIEALQKDPKHLHTLLPSKLNRGAAATIRIKTNDYRTNNRTIRRQTATRSRRESTVHRRTSAAGEVQVSMLPDLSEMRSNEQTAWEEIMLIKSLPIPMSKKKEMKSKILNEPNLRLQGYEQFKWKRRKMWGHLKSRLQESLLQNLELWRGSLKYIEGNFGTGIVAYFLFVRWLFILNLFIFSVVFLYINLPTILLDFNKNIACPDSTDTCCVQRYFNETVTGNHFFVDFVQGTGFLEKTLLFYGFYTNETLEYTVAGFTMYYNVPVAYMFVVILCFGFSVFSILTSAAHGFRERLIEGEGQFYHYCSIVFGGWDFCIDNEKAAKIKQKLIYNELKANVETEKLNEEIQSRTTQEKYKIYFCRFIVNTVVLSILAFCGGVIFKVFSISTGQIIDNDGSFVNLFFEFLPSITIVGMNIVVPIFFNFLISFEKYKPLTALKFSLMRTVFLRLSALIVLYASLWSKINCSTENQNTCVRCPTVPLCWESYVGQQIYKLLLTDFATQIVITFIINAPRALLARHVGNKLTKLLCEQTFQLPRHALDVVYTQTLIWFGIFYTPLVSLMGTGMFFFIFYIKKFACVYNCKPSPIIYRASRSNSMFMFVLLISFAFAALPLGFSFSYLYPSKSCGPFRDQPSVWNLAVSLFIKTPQWIQSIIFFLGTAGFAVPCIIVLTLFLYYYMGVNSANRHLVAVLKNQLVLEGHDKQFLLDRLSLFIKQENQKRLRMEQRRGDEDTN